MQHQQPIVDYAPPQQNCRRPFLSRPFWRDYIVAYVLIGVGATIADAGIPERGWHRWLLLVPGMMSVVAGCAVFVCAIAHRMWARTRGGDRRDP